jgi:NAD(P)-dependent dehydrogenase (short-subunit alcohol dehydrogenase family)
VSGLAGRVAVVTGGAGTGAGLGRGLVRRFAAHGMRVAVLDVDGAAADALAMELGATGVDALACTVDVREPASLTAAAARVDAAFGGCHVLCAHVGGGAFGAIDLFTLDEWRDAFELMVIGTVATVQAFLPLLRASDGPRRIVLTSSAAALAPGRFQGPYRAAKAAVTSIGETLQLELEGEGIETTIVFPSGMLPPVAQNGDAPPPSLEGLEPLDPEVVAIAEEMAAHPADIATGDEAAEVVVQAVLEQRHYVATHGATVVWRARERHARVDAALTELQGRGHRAPGAE